MTGEWRSPTTDDLLDAIAALPDREATASFLRDLCTLRELHDMAQRWQIVQLLDQGRHYAEISRETGASTATVTRIAQWLKHGTGGYRAALDRGAGVAARQRGDDPTSREALPTPTAREPARSAPTRDPARGATTRDPVRSASAREP